MLWSVECFLLLLGVVMQFASVRAGYADQPMCDMAASLGLQGSTWLNGWKCTNNIPDSPISSWDGVAVGANGGPNVILLHPLITGYLYGSLPSTIGQLTELTRMELGVLGIRGTLPNSIVQLTNLQILYLYTNSFQGTVPSELGNMKSLKVLQMSGNMLGGPVPASIQKLTGLEYFNCFTNCLTGTIPSGIGLATNLYFLSLGNNRIVGSLPSSIGALNKLARFDVSGNLLTGTIPESFGNLTELQYVDISQNQNIAGTVPASIGNIEVMTNFYLDTNNLDGTIPESFTKMTNLQILRAHENNFASNSFPVQLCTVPNLFITQTVYHECKIPTMAPTNVPTVSSRPTVTPTRVPTRVPTVTPTRVPTRVPTVSPTRVPTRVPTVTPTRVPTGAPTSIPTAPTNIPTYTPTTNPTVSPTDIPTAVPTVVPTASPTASPSTVPTRVPTSVPTIQPTRFPTRSPTLFESSLYVSDEAAACYADCSLAGVPYSSSWTDAEYCGFYYSSGCTQDTVASHECIPDCLMDCSHAFCDTFATLAYTCYLTGNSDMKQSTESACLASYASQSDTKTEMTFTSGMTWSNVGVEEMQNSADAQLAARQAMADSLEGVSVEDVSIADMTAASDTRRNLRNAPGGATGNHLSLADSPAVKVLFSIRVLLENLGYSSADAAAAYDSLSSQITAAVDSGDFQQKLTSALQAIDPSSTIFSNIDVSKVMDFSDMAVVPLETRAPTQSPGSDSGASFPLYAIIIVAVGGALLIGGVVVYFVTSVSSSTKKTTNPHTAVPQQESAVEMNHQEKRVEDRVTHAGAGTMLGE